MRIATAQEHWDSGQPNREQGTGCKCPLCEVMPRLLELETRIQRVRDLHEPDLVFADTCSECSEYESEESMYFEHITYPCPTIQALEGDQK